MTTLNKYRRQFHFITLDLNNI
ncbi:hypothetical protein KPSB59_1790028 [Klebsiella quasipneumoniae subsp. quasipneumoniae]|nr:hypothetical protein KPSB59_1790028 [Klebsiella quasipneumoniae subsp. quasipneumoniae]CDQ14612.1 hypothetical protein KQQSB11_280033 [Klebsiella quasipneumoniae subsp. quasipneumoniae]